MKRAVAEARYAGSAEASSRRWCLPAICSAFAENDIDLRWLAARLTENYAQCWTYSVDGLVALPRRCS